MAKRLFSGLSSASGLSIIGDILRKRQERRYPMDEKLPRRSPGPFDARPGPFDFGTILED